MNTSRNLASVVENSNGKIFRVSFVKKDPESVGNLSPINCNHMIY